MELLDVGFKQLQVVALDELCHILHEANIDIVVLQFEALECLVFNHRFGKHGARYRSHIVLL